jgi:hypothetical protein
VKDSWDKCGVEVQAKILAFDQTMQHDEEEREAQLAGARKPLGSAAPSKKTPAKKPSGKKSAKR